MSLIAELKRRRVFRVAGAYLVGAWIVLQIADIVFPALHFPPWTLTFVVVAAVMGFPVALILGWIFDLTPGGIEKTAGSIPFPSRAAAVGTLIVATGVVGFVSARRYVVASDLDPNAVVVLPFRVLGDARLEVMREGMVDLLAAKLSGEAGMRALDSRTTLAEWRERIESEDEDLPALKAMHLARDLGAGGVLLGEMIANGSTVAINAKLYSAVTGGAIATASDTASADDVLRSVDRLVAKLLASQAGQSDRIEALLSASLPAVQHYLRGQQEYRRGQYTDAAKTFERALAIDSTFALAALGQALSIDWAGPSAGVKARADRLAFRYRDRLPARERDFVLARLGPNWPQTQSAVASIRAWEQLAFKYPDRAEVWYELGDRIYHLSRAAGMGNGEERAMTAWARALELDSAYAAPMEHLTEIYIRRGDTVRLKVAFERVTRLRSREKTHEQAWYFASAMNDDTLRNRLLAEAPKYPRSDVWDMALLSQINGLPNEGVDSLLAILHHNATTEGERGSALYNTTVYALNSGQIARARNESDAAAKIFPRPAVAGVELIAALSYDEYRQFGEEAVKSLTSPDRFDRCNVGRWSAANGRAQEARAHLAEVDQWLATDTLPPPGGRVCRALLATQIALLEKSRRARAHADVADSLLVNGPLLAQANHFQYTLALATLYEEMGDYGKAREVAARRLYGFANMGLAPLLLKHARLSARTGQREEAIESYRLYLAMRDNPDPGLAKENTDKARAELAALTSR